MKALVAVVLSALFSLPVFAVESYEFFENFREDNPEEPFSWTNWRKTNEGNWVLDYDSDWSSPYFIKTDNDAKGTVLYRVLSDGVQKPQNYQITGLISSGDNDSLGLVFYYLDDDNYYRLTVNNEKHADAGDDDFQGYGHSVYLTSRVSGVDELLAIAPWPGTHHMGCDGDSIPCVVSPFQIIKLRVKIITSGDSNYILGQYYNPSIDGYVNLFDEIHKHQNTDVDGGLAGAFASDMGKPKPLYPANGGGRVHNIEVKHIDRVIDIVKADVHPHPLSDRYLLDYKDVDGDQVEDVKMKYVQYTPDAATAEEDGLYWFLSDEQGDRAPYGSSANGAPIPIRVPVGESRISLYDNSNGSGEPVTSKEVWVSSESAFTVAVLPDLHVGQSDTIDEKTVYYRDIQVRSIMREIRNRHLFEEEDIRAVIQVGDVSFRGREDQFISAEAFLRLLPYDMPLITAMGNHDYDSYWYGWYEWGDWMPSDRASRWADMYLYDLVTERAGITTDAFGSETPNEVDNIYFLLDEEDLGGAGSGSGKWMVLSLQSDPMIRDLFWADKVLRSHPDYNVILVTHQFLTESGNVENLPITHWALGQLFTGANSGQQVWDFLKTHEQIKIILDGHTTMEGGLFTKLIKRNWPGAGAAQAILTDVSYTHAFQGAGGQFRLLEIDPKLNKLRGRLVYARSHEHESQAYGPYALPGQAINAVHRDTFFINDIDLSNRGCPAVWLFEDFNRGLPDLWVGHDDGTPESNWRVDMSNATDSPEYVELSTGVYENQTNIKTKMSRYGRVQQTENTYGGNAKGTYLVYDEKGDAKEWSNYTFEVDISPGDNDGIGVMFYYTGDDSYYRFFLYNNENAAHSYYLEKISPGQTEYKREIIKKGGGLDQHWYSQHQPYKIVVDLRQSGHIVIDVFDDIYDSKSVTKGNFLHLDVPNSSYNKGTIALYSYAMSTGEYNDAGAIFDNVLVAGADNTPPEINCPAAITASNDPGLCGAKADYEEPAGMDGCSRASTSLTGGLGSGSVFPVGSTTETYTVTNAAGLSASCSFAVTISDNEFPGIRCPADITVNNDPSECGALVSYATPVGTDNCPGASTAQTAGLGAGSFFPVGATIETYAVTDAAYWVNACTFTATVKDAEVPKISCPENIEVEPTSPAGATVTYTEPAGSDNCSAATAQTVGLGSGATFPIGTTAETFTVTDDARNAASCTFTVKVLSPVEVVGKLQEKIEQLITDGKLKRSHSKGLINKLEQIIVKLERASPLKPACNQLNAFINEISGFFKSGRMTVTDSDALINSAINAAKGAGCGEAS